MQKRNIDKIKDQERELVRYRKKVMEQHKEISRLHSNIEIFQGGLREMNKSADALCTAVALKFGAEVGLGAFEAVLPEIRVEELLRDYTLSVSPKDGMYIIRVEERVDECRKST